MVLAQRRRRIHKLRRGDEHHPGEWVHQISRKHFIARTRVFWAVPRWVPRRLWNDDTDKSCDGVLAAHQAEGTEGAKIVYS